MRRAIPHLLLACAMIACGAEPRREAPAVAVEPTVNTPAAAPTAPAPTEPAPTEPAPEGPEPAPTACPPGTCRRHEGGPCEPPTGQLGNACCGCGSDGFCSDPCRCAALDTPVETPDGPRAIASLSPGDLVISVDRGRRRAVPIVRVSRARAIDRQIVRVVLATGATLRMSPAHPTADGRTFAELRAGDRLDGIAIVSSTLELYDLPETADILPDSDTGTYLAAGVLVGSTLFEGPAPDRATAR